LKKSIRNFLLFFCLGIFIFSGWKLWEICSSYLESRKSYDLLNQYVSFSEEDADSTMPAATIQRDPDQKVDPVPEEVDLSAWPEVDFARLFEINPEVVGWIYIEGTNINYPVVKGADNDYYLNHLFDGTYNAAGCIFLDYRCSADFSDQNSVIYGHHMNDRSMFAGLMDYTNQDFYNEHSVVLLVTPNAYYKIQLFSGYVSDTRSGAWKLSFSQDEYLSWLDGLQRKSCFEADDMPTTEDRIVTLSTCTYEFDAAKFVLHGYISEVIENPSLGDQ